MDQTSQFLTVAVVSLLAAISPGPDFFIVVKNSLSSRKAGLITAFGVCVALIVHLTYSLVGLGVLLAESPILYTILKYVGVAYLLYLGVSGIVSSYKQGASMDVKSGSTVPLKQAFTQGFLTNLLNPKCALFFISLFSQFIDPYTSPLLRFEYGFINWVVSLSWFLFLAYVITSQGIKGKLDRFKIYVDRVMGSALVLLGMKMLFI